MSNYLKTKIVYNPEDMHVYHLLVNLTRDGSGDVIFSEEKTKGKKKTETFIQEKKIRAVARKRRDNFDLENFIKKNNLSTGAKSPAKSPAKSLAKSPAKSPARGDKRVSKFSEESELPERQMKYCSCVIDVAAKQNLSCLKKKDWGEGKSCYNPYSVCARSTGTSSRECGKNYQLENFNDEQLKAFGALMGVKIPSPYTKSAMLKSIKEKKIEKYGE